MRQFEQVFEVVNPLIETTICKLNEKKFKADPILGAHFSRMNSLLGSAQKRHGLIIERAILETLKTYSEYEAWEDPKFPISDAAEHQVSAEIDNPLLLINANSPSPDEHRVKRTLQTDMIVYNHEAQTLRSYEIKRGNGLHDAGKRRSMLKDLLCTQVLLKSYGEKRGFVVKEARSYAIFYYGACSIAKPFSLTKDELDDHFSVPVLETVEAVNEVYKRRLFEVLAE